MRLLITIGIDWPLSRKRYGILRRSRRLDRTEYHVTQDGHWFFANNATLSVVGTGLTHAAAVRDLFSHLVHFRHYFRSLKDTQVTGDAVRLKALFQAIR